MARNFPSTIARCCLATTTNTGRSAINALRTRSPATLEDGSNVASTNATNTQLSAKRWRCASRHTLQRGLRPQVLHVSALSCVPLDTHQRAGAEHQPHARTARERTRSFDGRATTKGIPLVERSSLPLSPCRTCHELHTNHTCTGRGRVKTPVQ